MKILFALALVLAVGAGFYLGKAVYKVNLTPGQCIDAATQTVGESIDNFIKNVKG